MLKLPGIILVVLGLLLVSARPTVANPIFFNDKVFIDNRPANDPLATGLFLNLGVGFTDTSGVSGVNGTVTTPFLQNPLVLASDPGVPPGAGSLSGSVTVTPGQFSMVTGTYLYHACDANGCFDDTSHNLNHPEWLLFPTNLTLSNLTTTPVFTMTDPNGAVGAGVTRGFELRLYDASLNEIFDFGAQLPGPFQVPTGLLQVGHAYSFRAEIDDFDTAELNADIASNNFDHNPIQSRSTAWLFNFTPQATAVPEPGTMVLLGTGVIGGVRRLRRRGHSQ